MKFLLQSEGALSSSQLAREDSIPEPNTSISVEKDPTGLVSTAPGAKLDAGKVDVLRGAIQYFPRSLKAIARVSELGAKKYSWKGWEKVPNGRQRYGAALTRHLLVEDDFATDNGPGGLGEEVLHASQVAWNACARLELILRELEEQNARVQSVCEDSTSTT
jgi:Domain of unknown function (DUF5664)